MIKQILSSLAEMSMCSGALITLLLLPMLACTQPGTVPSPDPVGRASVATEAMGVSAGKTDMVLVLPYRIVDTGQAKCYDNFREIDCPPAGGAFWGQDAQHRGMQPAYKDNGDGTVSDLVTGLMWQKDPGAKVNYAQAIVGAGALSLAGYGDWRLPTIKELYSLILFSGTDPRTPQIGAGPVPFVDTQYFAFQYGNTAAGERVIDSQYWSATPYVGTTMGGNATVFGVNFADGRIKGYPRDTGPGARVMTEFVRYVRGQAAYGINSYKDNGDSTVTDFSTGLMWSRADSGVGMNWQDALAWVQQKNSARYLGYNDWRMPNAKELQSIVDYSRAPDVTSSAALNPIFRITSITNEAGKADYPFFWTGTTHFGSDGNASNAVYIAFGRALGCMPFTAGVQSSVGYAIPPGGQPGPGTLPPANLLLPPVGQNNPGQGTITRGSGTIGCNFIDVHGAGAQRSDPKYGRQSDYISGRGPQGDSIRIYNFVRLVRDAG